MAAMADQLLDYPRHVEIERRLRQQPRVWEPWVALDDKDYWFKPVLSNLVLCDANTGMDDAVGCCAANKAAGRILGW